MHNSRSSPWRQPCWTMWHEGGGSLSEGERPLVPWFWQKGCCLCRWSDLNTWGRKWATVPFIHPRERHPPPSTTTISLCSVIARHPKLVRDILVLHLIVCPATYLNYLKKYCKQIIIGICTVSTIKPTSRSTPHIKASIKHILMCVCHGFWRKKCQTVYVYHSKQNKTQIFNWRNKKMFSWCCKSEVHVSSRRCVS